jgi:hypothetical protein
MLKNKGIHFQVCRNPDVKSSTVGRAQLTVRDKIYRYFTYTNSNRYIDVLQKFVDDYNDTVHSATGMAPSRVTHSDVLALWQRMNKHIRRVRTVSARFIVGQHVGSVKRR